MKTLVKSKLTTSLILLTAITLLAACGGTDANIEDSSIQTATLRLPGYEQPEDITYRVVDGLAMMEGDIVLGEVDARGKLIDSPYEVDPSELGTSSFSVFEERFLWPNGIVPYVIGANVPNAMQYDIRDAIRYWELNTNISFVEVDLDEQDDYVEFVAQDGGVCSSDIGRTGGRQFIRIGRDCRNRRGTVMHEIGHAVGLFHEHTRRDRDEFVEIIEENILPGSEGNFQIPSRNTRTIGRYDYNSIMHYGTSQFSRNGEPTIRTLNGASIGQMVYLSGEDIRGINARYPGSATPSHTGASPAVHMELKQGGVVKCKVYNTPANTAPTVTGCPSGSYVEQLFDKDWSQVDERNVVIN